MTQHSRFRPVKNSRLEVNLYSIAGQMVFITIRACQGFTPFQNPTMCKMVIETLLEMAKDSHFQIIVYCLMPDHFHFIISPNEDGYSVIQFLDRFKGKTTQLSWRLGWTGRLWQPRFYDHIIRSDENLVTICNYVLQNPIRKGLVDTIDDWPWCKIVSD